MQEEEWQSDSKIVTEPTEKDFSDKLDCLASDRKVVEHGHRAIFHQLGCIEW